MRNNNPSKIKTYKIYHSNTRDEILTVKALSTAEAVNILLSQLLGENKPEDVVILSSNKITLARFYYSIEQDNKITPNYIIEYKIIEA